jgi:GntR family transcriptional repressor for pyruvate dehydrogenase complex
MNITALQRPGSLVESVCQQLAKLIRRDRSDEERWLPGERLLAEKLGVSRSVVREATKRLEQQGMLEIQHGNGIKVVDRLHRPLNDSLSLLIPDVAERLHQLNGTRLAIEPESARLAAERATRTQLRTLRRIHATLEAAPDAESAIEADLAFHRAVAEASGNLIFRLVLDSLADLGQASRQRTIGKLGKETAVEHHARILAAIEQHDAAAAEKAMRDHIQSAGRDLSLDTKRTRK